MYDCHIHMQWGKSDTPEQFMEKTRQCGVTGGGIMGLHPMGYEPEEGADMRWENRLDKLLEFTSQTPGFHPIFWIDPTDYDISLQIKAAKEKGVKGFKVICNHFYPADTMKVWNMIAETGMPVMFHCGILYSHTPASKYNKPLEFECLMTVPKFKFSLAHIGWPWTDEYVSLAGEFGWGSNNCNMYIDLTPGTPMVYRYDALEKVYLSAPQKRKQKVIWGSDVSTNNYHVSHVTEQIKLDIAIMKKLVNEAPKYQVVKGWDYDKMDDIWELCSVKNAEDFFA